MSARLPIALSFKALAGVYLILPAMALLALADVFLFNRTIQSFMPTDLSGFLWYVILFNLPHIIASYFSFADTEYLAHYRTQILTRLPLVLLAFVLLIIFAPTLSWLALVAYTFYHMVSQQAGIGYLYGGKPHRLHMTWKWVAIVITTLAYLNSVQPSFLENFVSESILFWTLVVGHVVFLALSIPIARSLKLGKGSAYFVLTVTAILEGYLLILVGYPILSLFLWRFMHDVTAMIIYATHDHNRAAVSNKNLAYRFIPRALVPIAFLVPLLAIAVALPISFTLYNASLMFGTLILVAHCYLESFIWKNGTPHRKHLALTA